MPAPERVESTFSLGSVRPVIVQFAEHLHHRQWTAVPQTTRSPKSRATLDAL